VFFVQRHQRYVMVDLDREEDEEATRGLVGALGSGGGHGEQHSTVALSFEMLGAVLPAMRVGCI
jgi:hypothetical protein